MDRYFRVAFNQPFLTGKETEYILDAVSSLKLSGNGKFTKLCHNFFKERYRFKQCLLTSSCTDALEMAALLLNIKADDEVIVPSYTFVSTANPFVLRGAKIVFADSEARTPNIDANLLEALITKNTKAIVVVHYAGVACDMDKIMEIALRYQIPVVEDAAHGIDAYYRDQPLGSIGTFGTFSFHETKNVIAGEGGMLVVNAEEHKRRAEILWEKGTDRAAFFRGEVDKYRWVDVGSSFLPSEIIAAFLFAQLENIDRIQKKRCSIWQQYLDRLTPLQQAGLIQLPHLPNYASLNGHLFYLICRNGDTRDALLKYLQSYDIHAIFHYLALHQSPFYKDKHDGRELPQADRYTECLMRVPLYYDLTEETVDLVCDRITTFFS